MILCRTKLKRHFFPADYFKILSVYGIFPNFRPYYLEIIKAKSTF